VSEVPYHGVGLNPGCYVKAQCSTSRQLLRIPFIVLLDYNLLRAASCLGCQLLGCSSRGCHFGDCGRLWSATVVSVSPYEQVRSYIIGSLIPSSSPHHSWCHRTDLDLLRGPKNTIRRALVSRRLFAFCSSQQAGSKLRQFATAPGLIWVKRPLASNFHRGITGCAWCALTQRRIFGYTDFVI